ncbi:MAG: hypothetical protein J6M93_00875 [Succinivibrio sp.]|nr:hypothetical protein [Succinivibrio sp.]
MITINSVNNGINVLGSAQDTGAKTGNTKMDTAVQTKSAVVELQGKSEKTAAVSSSVAVNKNNAAAMAADIAALLGGSGMATQANVSGFDAARLLA